MTRSIWKFSLALASQPQAKEIPLGATIVCVAMQGRSPTMWADVDTSRAVRPRMFVVRGTGHDVPDGAKYLGTAFDGGLVWHVFEVPNA